MIDARKSLRVSWSGTVCALYDGNELLLHGPWKDYEELANALRRVGRKQTPMEYAFKGQLQARAVGEQQAMLCIGRWIRPMSYADLVSLSAAMLQAARQAEAQEPAVGAQQAADGALLVRAGLPFGLSNDPKVKSEVAKTAAWDSTLRKNFPFVQARPIPDIPRVQHTSTVDALSRLYAQREQLRKEVYGSPST